MASCVVRRSALLRRLALLAVVVTVLIQMPATGWAAASSPPGDGSGTAATPGPTTTPAPPKGNPVRLLLRAINRDRQRYHIPPLTLDTSESRCSHQHSVHMARQGYISHDQFPADICVSHTWMGENVGEAPDDPVTSVIELHQMFMDEGPCPHNKCATSAQFEKHGHFINLLNSNYHRIGIGVFVARGMTWLTEDFMG